ncbi:hypothetical protein KHQ88_05835 [Mycoplasmatota bacterium]|nr:hypothetical protein KHQ88_05835 [Mycoplasmatota bacterium]
MKKRIVVTMPMISLFLLLVSGFVFNNWRLGFSFLLLIPLSTILLSNQIGKRIYQNMPLITIILFFWLAFGLDLAHPGWVVFFLIPISDMIYRGHINARKLVSVIITIIYVIIGILYTRNFFPESLKVFGDSFWHPGWLIFLLIPIINNLFFPNKSSFIYFKKADWKNKFNTYMNSDYSDDHHDYYDQS